MMFYDILSIGPHVHVVSTLLGLAVGYKVHLIEENFEEDLRKQKKLHPLAPYHPKETLLTDQAMVKRREEQEKIGDLDDESKWERYQYPAGRDVRDRLQTSLLILSEFR